MPYDPFHSSLNFKMDASDYMQLIVQALSNMEATAQLLRTAVSTLCEHATFEPNKKILLQPAEVKLIESIRAMALNNVSLKLIETGSKRSTNNSMRESLVFQG